MRVQLHKIIVLIAATLTVPGAFARPPRGSRQTHAGRAAAAAHRKTPSPAVSTRRAEARPHAATPIPTRQDSPEDTVHVHHDRRPHKTPQGAEAPVEQGRYALPPPAVLLPALYNRRGQLIVPPALKGSHEILVHQNEMANLDGLDRVQDDDDLERMRESRMLVAIPSIAGIQTDERLPANRRYCRPWTANFLAALARSHYARFHSRLQVNSAVRTVEFQQRLIRTNGNAAPAEGETASPHLTGQAIDLAKHGLSLSEIAWLRGYLMPLVQEGKIDVEEEFQQSCFHISVYRKYMPAPAEKRTIAGINRSARGLAMALR